MELIVTMVISGLIIMAAYQLISNLTRMSILNTKENAWYTNIFQFHKAISQDMQQAITLKHYDDETIFNLKEDISISYRWDYDYIVRTVNETTDTFFIELKDWHMIKNRKTGLPQVLEMEIVNDEHETEMFRLEKKYDNDIMMNTTELK